MSKALRTVKKIAAPPIPLRRKVSDDTRPTQQALIWKSHTKGKQGVIWTAGRNGHDHESASGLQLVVSNEPNIFDRSHGSTCRYAVVFQPAFGELHEKRLSGRHLPLTTPPPGWSNIRTK